MMRVFLGFAICATLLAACASPALHSVIGGLAGRPVLQSVVGGLAGTTTTASSQPAADAPQIWLTLPSRGVKFAMSELDSNGDATIFAARDGTQVFLSQGILIGTRGFGRDLMSADGLSLANLQTSTRHQRSYYDMDGTDQMIRHKFNCKGEIAADGGNLVESCESDIGTIRNEFWLNANKSVIKSKQWVSQGVGYAMIEPKVD